MKASNYGDKEKRKRNRWFYQAAGVCRDKTAPPIGPDPQDGDITLILGGRSKHESHKSSNQAVKLFRRLSRTQLYNTV